MCRARPDLPRPRNPARPHEAPRSAWSLLIKPHELRISPTHWGKNHAPLDDLCPHTCLARRRARALGRRAPARPQRLRLRQATAAAGAGAAGHRIRRHAGDALQPRVRGRHRLHGDLHLRNDRADDERLRDRREPARPRGRAVQAAARRPAAGDAARAGEHQRDERQPEQARRRDRRLGLHGGPDAGRAARAVRRLALSELPGGRRPRRRRLHRPRRDGDPPAHGVRGARRGLPAALRRRGRALPEHPGLPDAAPHGGRARRHPAGAGDVRLPGCESEHGQRRAPLLAPRVHHLLPPAHGAAAACGRSERRQLAPRRQPARGPQPPDPRPHGERERRAAAPMSFMQIQVPAGLPDLGAITLNQNRTTMTINGPGSFRVSALSMTGKSKLYIDNAGGPVTLYVTGGVSVAGTAKVYIADPDPEHFAIYVAGTGPVDLENGTPGLYGVVYAPTSSVLIGGSAQFPGFFVMPNRVVPSAALPGWSGVAEGRPLYQNILLAVDGVPIAAADDGYRRAAAHSAGEPAAYLFARADGVETRTFATRILGNGEYLAIFGAYAFTALVYLLLAAVASERSAEGELYRGLAALGWASAAFGFTAMDLYGPGGLFRLHVLSEALLWAAATHLVLAYPEDRVTGRAGVLPLVYGVGLAFAAVYEFFAYEPGAYSALHNLSQALAGIPVLVLVARLALAIDRPPRALGRAGLRRMLAGTLAGLIVPAIVLGVSGATGGRIPVNASAWVGFLFPLACLSALWQTPAHPPRAA